jgi:hypothetical protein
VETPTLPDSDTEGRLDLCHSDPIYEGLKVTDLSPSRIRAFAELLAKPLPEVVASLITMCGACSIAKQLTDTTFGSACKVCIALAGMLTVFGLFWLRCRGARS